MTRRCVLALLILDATRATWAVQRMRDGVPRRRVRIVVRSP